MGSRAALYCILIIIGIFLSQFPLSWAVLRSRLQIGSVTDRRISLVNSLILGIQTIKNYVWEQPVIDRILKARRVECRRFLCLYFWKGLSDGIS